MAATSMEELRLDIDQEVARLALAVMDSLKHLPAAQLEILSARFEKTSTLKLRKNAASVRHALELIGWSYSTAVFDARRKRREQQLVDAAKHRGTEDTDGKAVS